LKELNSLGLDVVPVEPKEVIVEEVDVAEIEKDKVILADDDATLAADDSASPMGDDDDDDSDDTTSTLKDDDDLDDLEGPSDEELKESEL
jgi:hypothetical protein